MMNQATRYGMSQEEKDELYNKLTEKFGYDKVKFDQPMEEATESAGNKRFMGSLIDGLAQIGTANAVARGGKGYDGSAGKILNQAADSSLAEAGAKRKAMIEDYLTKKNLHESVESQSSDMAKQQIAKERYDAEMARRDEDRAYNRSRDVAQDAFQDKLLDDKRADRAAELATKADMKAEELEIPGFGQARTAADAKDMRTAIVDTESAIADLNQVKELGTDVNLTDIKKRELIDQLLNAATGKLRLSMTGPGAMTDSERLMIRNSIGDPSKLMSTESIEKAKLDQLIKGLGDRLEREASVRVKDYKGKPKKQDLDPRVKSFMETNGITDEAEAIKILTDAGKL